MIGAGETLQFGGKRGAGERAGGENDERVGLVGVERGDLFAVDGDAWGSDAVMRAATRRENSTRSTARAWPAGTALASASARRIEPARRISCLRSHGAVFSDSDLRELEQTSSAKSAVWWASVERVGRISYSSTWQPSAAACSAASGPARPPPMTLIFFMVPA